MIADDPHFPTSYAQGRERFLTAAASRGARLDACAHPLRGADGEALAVDLASLGPPDAPDVVLLHSGTHGVEGYCGSGIQHALLTQGPEIDDALAAGARVLLMHALNPWGFSWRRRVTEDNVDLNRNFRDFATPAGPDPDYADVHPLVLPETWPWTADNAAAITGFIAARGPAHWQYAVSHGQRTHPDGVFYAGNAPTWSNRTLHALLARHVRGARAVWWIDVHTGLGPSGHGEMIYGGRDDPDDLARTRACWGERVTSIFDGSSASAKVEGSVGAAMYTACPGTRLAAIGLEFGTLPLPEMLEALRFDHWVAARAPGDAALRERARAAMMRAFFVDTPQWKSAVLAQGRDAFAKATADVARRQG